MDHDPSITIQLVTAANAALLDRIDPDVFDHPVRADLLAQFLAQPNNVLAVALNQGVVVGMASGFAYVHPDKPLSLFLNEVGVSARFHRRGIASRLIAAVLDHARSIGCREAWVATETDNLPARELYRRTGAREDDQHAVVYVYTLAPSA
jgi:ribosomal protein S18 acetylase RimI-like enzyme